MEQRTVMMRHDAGEGSRGGKIIGHTKSGKPIYMNHSHSSHTSFTEHEHRQAAALHDREGRVSLAEDPSNENKKTAKHWKAEEHHKKEANELRKAKSK